MENNRKKPDKQRWGKKATGSVPFDFHHCALLLQFAIIVGYMRGQSLEKEHLINTWFLPSFIHLHYLQRFALPTIFLQASSSFMHISLHLYRLCRCCTNCLATEASANTEAQCRVSSVKTVSKYINNQG